MHGFHMGVPSLWKAPPEQLIQYFIPESMLVLEERKLEAEVVEATLTHIQTLH